MRPIDADELVKRTEEFKCDWNEKTAPYSWNHAYDSFIDIIDEQPTVGDWISVKDRLPERGGTYLCFQPLAASFCMVNTYRWSTTNNGWRGAQIGSVITGITHWMPLPEPPKENAK